MLCLKLLLQFSSYLNETCYTWFLWFEDVHDIIFVRPLSKFLYIHISCDKAGIGSIHVTISDRSSLVCLQFFCEWHIKEWIRKGSLFNSTEDPIALTCIFITVFRIHKLVHWKQKNCQFSLSAHGYSRGMCVVLRNLSVKTCWYWWMKQANSSILYYLITCICEQLRMIRQHFITSPTKKKMEIILLTSKTKIYNARHKQLVQFNKCQTCIYPQC